MVDSLQHSVIWQTRSTGGPSQLGPRLERRGARVLYGPVLEIEALPREHPAMEQSRQRLQALASYSHVIFISGNAVKYGMDLIGADFPTAAHCYAIGQSTARQLEQFGLRVLQPAAGKMNSEALLELPQLQSLAGQKVLVVRGLGGREYLAGQLRQKGAEVDYLEAYRRVKSGTLPEEISRLTAAGAIDYILAASGETVSALVELVDRAHRQQLLGTSIVVPGARVSAIAHGLGFRHVLEAVNAGDDAMLEAVLGATLAQG